MPLPPDYNNPIFPSKIDSSILSSFDSCRQKFFREYILGLSPQAQSPDLVAGGAFARGIEVTRLDLWVNNLSLEDSLLHGAWAISDEWGDFDPEPEKYGKPHVKSLVNTVSALYSYFEEYSPDTDHIKPYIYANGKPAVEFSFAIDMDVINPDTGEPFIFCGRCDLIGQHNSLRAVVDEKTTTSLGSKWPDKWTMRGQFLGYCFAAQNFGLDITTAIIRGIAFQVKSFQHGEAIVTFGQWQIDRWWQEANMKVQEMADLWVACKGLSVEEMSEVYRHSYADACDNYGGCVFKNDLCTSQHPENWISNYDVRRWDPLAKNPAIPLITAGNAERGE